MNISKFALKNLSPYRQLPFFTSDDIPFYKNLKQELEYDLALVRESVKAVKANLNSYALTTHPGHHAGESMGRYCYINTIGYAISLLNTHEKIAVLDIDYHFGDGTRYCLNKMGYDTFFASVHMDTMYDYPYGIGTEEENTNRAKNYIIPPKTEWEGYKVQLACALDDIQKFNPKYLIISLGLDTLRGDDESNVHGGINLTIDDFKSMGKVISDKISVPKLIIQEGGYKMDTLGEACKNFLEGAFVKDEDKKNKYNFI